MSRVEKVIPFIPFSSGEQAVVAHKFLLASFKETRKDIDLRPEVKRYMGHCDVSVIKDGDVCRYFSDKGYRVNSGARGIARAVGEVPKRMLKLYLSLPGKVTENMNEGPLVLFNVRPFLVNGHLNIDVTHVKEGKDTNSTSSKGSSDYTTTGAAEGDYTGKSED